MELITELCVNALLIGGTIVGLLLICLVGGCLIRGIVRLIKGLPVLADDDCTTRQLKCPTSLPKGNTGNNKTKE